MIATPIRHYAAIDAGDITPPLIADVTPSLRLMLRSAPARLFALDARCCFAYILMLRCRLMMPSRFSHSRFRYLLMPLRHVYYR